MGKGHILKVEGLTRSFGALMAVYGINIAASEGELIAIIGPNGAGKTTLFNLISGTLKPTSGHIFFKGEDISHLPACEISKRGIVRTFQITQLLPQLTTLENVRLASQFKRGGSLRIFGGKDIIKETERKSEEILDFMGLSKVSHFTADHLSHGDQRLLELSMALAQDPEILLLDEPTAGLSAEETHKTAEILKNISSKKKNTILLVEHDMDVVFDLAERIIVLHFGEVIAEGSKENIKGSDKVQKAYLGGLE